MVEHCMKMMLIYGAIAVVLLLSATYLLVSDITHGITQGSIASSGSSSDKTVNYIIDGVPYSGTIKDASKYSFGDLLLLNYNKKNPTEISVNSAIPNVSMYLSFLGVFGCFVLAYSCYEKKNATTAENVV
jgi:hypothetical protein